MPPTIDLFSSPIIISSQVTFFFIPLSIPHLFSCSHSLLLVSSSGMLFIVHLIIYFIGWVSGVHWLGMTLCLFCEKCHFSTSFLNNSSSHLIVITIHILTLHDVLLYRSNWTTYLHSTWNILNISLYLIFFCLFHHFLFASYNSYVVQLRMSCVGITMMYPIDDEVYDEDNIHMRYPIKKFCNSSGSQDPFISTCYLIMSLSLWHNSVYEE